jgi:hypothetical protein
LEFKIEGENITQWQINLFCEFYVQVIHLKVEHKFYTKFEGKFEFKFGFENRKEKGGRKRIENKRIKQTQLTGPKTPYSAQHRITSTAAQLHPPCARTHWCVGPTAQSSEHARGRLRACAGGALAIGPYLSVSFTRAPDFSLACGWGPHVIPNKPPASAGIVARGRGNLGNSLVPSPWP